MFPVTHIQVNPCMLRLLCCHFFPPGDEEEGKEKGKLNNTQRKVQKFHAKVLKRKNQDLRQMCFACIQAKEKTRKKDFRIILKAGKEKV